MEYPPHTFSYLSFIRMALYFSWRLLNLLINSSKLRSTCRGVCNFKFCKHIVWYSSCIPLSNHIFSPLERDLILSVPVWISHHFSLIQSTDWPCVPSIIITCTFIGNVHTLLPLFYEEQQKSDTSVWLMLLVSQSWQNVPRININMFNQSAYNK